jgi:uncharacterized protein (DUF427 family)
MGQLDQLRYQPTAKRVRAFVEAKPIVDSTHAMLVWEPKRVVPSYAVPVTDVLGQVRPGGQGDAPIAEPTPLSDELPAALVPGDHPFLAHLCEGTPMSIRIERATLHGAAFKPSDPDLEGYVILDFDSFDHWLEEEDPIVGHPRDPFHRVDVRRSSRHVLVEVNGTKVAESSRPTLVFETFLPVRFYLPREDARMDLLRHTDTRTTCAYKGQASYWSLELDGETIPDIAWSYEQPLPDAIQLDGLIAFFDERVDVVLDGERRKRPRTPWSKPRS